MKLDSSFNSLYHKACNILACFIILLLHENCLAQFPNFPKPQPYTFPNYNGTVGTTPSSRSATPSTNGMIDDFLNEHNRRIQQQSERIRREYYEQQRRLQQQRAQEAIDDFEAGTSLNIAVCKSTIRMPDYTSRPGTNYFHGAFGGINKMLTGESPVNLKDAVFMVENAYYENTLDYNKREMVCKKNV